MLTLETTMQNEIFTTFGVVPDNVQQAILFDRGGAINVRILGKAGAVIRIAANNVFMSPSGTETVLQTENGDIQVRILYKRLEGQNILIGLQPLT